MPDVPGSMDGEPIGKPKQAMAVLLNVPVEADLPVLPPAPIDSAIVTASSGT